MRFPAFSLVFVFQGRAQSTASVAHDAHMLSVNRNIYGFWILYFLGSADFGRRFVCGLYRPFNSGMEGWMKHIANFSGGLCSFFATMRSIEQNGLENVIPLFADTLYEQP